MPCQLSLSGEDIPGVEVLGVAVQGELHGMHQVSRCLSVFIINLSKSWAVKIGSPYTGQEY